MTDKEKQIEYLAKRLRASAHDLRLDDNDDCYSVADFIVNTHCYRKMDEITLKLDLGDRSAEEIQQIAEAFNKAMVNEQTLVAVPSNDNACTLYEQQMDYDNIAWSCDNCSESWLMTDEGTPSEHNFHFCPNCGAKVIKEIPIKRR